MPKQAVIDGEVAVPDERGVTHISFLEEALTSNPGRHAQLRRYAEQAVALTTAAKVG